MVKIRVECGEDVDQRDQVCKFCKNRFFNTFYSVASENQPLIGLLLTLRDVPTFF